MSTKPTRRPDLKFVKEYLSSYCSGEVPPPIDLEGTASTKVLREQGFWTYSYGTPGFDEFNRVVARLHEKNARQQELSLKTIQECLYHALYMIADGVRGNPDDTETHIASAMEHINSILTSPLQTYECWLEVAGIGHDSLPLTLGGTAFAHLRPTTRDPSRLSLYKLPSSLPRATLTNMKDDIGNSFVGKVAGICCTQARDDVAAMEQAEEKVRSSIECLNFMIDLIEPGQARVSLPNERTSAGESSRVMVRKDHGPVRIMWRMHSPSNFSLGEWWTPGTPFGEAISTIDNFLNNRNLNPVESLLLSAVRWAGRAAAAKSPQDAFLFWAIALECLTIPSDNRELTYRLSHRVAHLLKDDYDERLRITRKVKALYDIRSKIVHDGNFSASIELQHEMREVVTQTIIRMLNDSRIRRSKSRRDLDAYFEELTLS